MGGAFDGVTVLDLSVAPGGAIAAMHLGEYGAHVVRVERAPDVDPARAALPGGHV